MKPVVCFKDSIKESFYRKNFLQEKAVIFATDF